jgi:hypothetical protein
MLQQLFRGKPQPPQVMLCQITGTCPPPPQPGGGVGR